MGLFDPRPLIEIDASCGGLPLDPHFGVGLEEQRPLECYAASKLERR